jgi:hypothetical protein
MHYRTRQTKAHIKKNARAAFMEDRWTPYSTPQLVVMEARRPRTRLYLKKTYDNRITDLIVNALKKNNIKDQRDLPKASTDDFQGLLNLCITTRIEKAMTRGEVVQLNSPMRFLRLHQYRDIPRNNINIPIQVVSPHASPTPTTQEQRKRQRLKQKMVDEFNNNLILKSRPWRPTYPGSYHLTTKPATSEGNLPYH